MLRPFRTKTSQNDLNIRVSSSPYSTGVVHGGDDQRVNPLYSHVKSYNSFTEDEKDDIVRRYLNGESVLAISLDSNAVHTTIEQILTERGVSLRDPKEAAVLANTTVITEDVAAQIKADFKKSPPPTITSLAKKYKILEATIRMFLLREGLYNATEYKDISERDQEKLLAAKRDANKRRVTLKIRDIGERLNLEHQNVTHSSILKLFAENGLNNPSEYSGALTYAQQRQILSYFPRQESGSYEQRSTISEISKAVGAGLNVISLFLYYNNIVPLDAKAHTKKQLPEDKKQEIISLLRQGKTNKDISLIVGESKRQVDAIIKEYRETNAEKLDRRTESRKSLRPYLVTRTPFIINYIKQARNQDPPLTFSEITEQLIILMRQQPGMEDFTIAWSTVRNIHLENS